MRLWHLSTKTCLKIFSHSDYGKYIWPAFQLLLYHFVWLLPEQLLHKKALMCTQLPSGVIKPLKIQVLTFDVEEKEFHV